MVTIDSGKSKFSLSGYSNDDLDQVVQMAKQTDLDGEDIEVGSLKGVKGKKAGGKKVQEVDHSDFE